MRVIKEERMPAPDVPAFEGHFQEALDGVQILVVTAGNEKQESREGRPDRKKAFEKDRAKKVACTSEGVCKSDENDTC